MSFALPLALLLALGIGLVVLAHALRRGRAEAVVFPAAHLLAHKAVTAKERNRLEDRVLFSLRALMVLSLALLAASPFVSCSRFTLNRPNGASVALVIVLDDSASMRALDAQGSSRFEKAKTASLDVLRDAQGGDSYALVLAGAPARVLVSPTTDASGLIDAVRALEPSDRATDLEGAITLARSLQAAAAQAARPVLLLSDLSSEETANLDLEGITIPDLQLTEPLSNCAIVSAQLLTQSVAVEVACTDAAALKGRTLELLDASDALVAPPIDAKDGALVIPLDKQPANAKPTRVRLSSVDVQQDHIPADDTSFLLRAAAELALAVRADVAKAGVKTGTDTVLQSGLEALERGVRVEPLSLLPDDEVGLSRYAALLIDDPSGFAPEIRSALEAWVRKGGVAVVFLGPDVERAPLGSNFFPFLESPAHWVATEATGTDPERAGALGPLTRTWNDLGARGRAHLQLPEDAQILASWNDGAPLVFARSLGQGLTLGVTLPVSVDRSDFALRPAYLELLDYIVSQTTLRHGATALPVGHPFSVPENAHVTGPGGQPLLPVRSRSTQVASAAGEATDTGSIGRDYSVTPELSGPYLVQSEGQSSPRFALRIASEHVTQPHPVSSSAATAGAQTAASLVGISRHVALLLLFLSFLELLFRVIRPGKSLFGGSGGLPAGRTSAKVPSP